MSSDSILPKLDVCSLSELAFCQGDLFVQEEKWLKLEGRISPNTYTTNPPKKTTAGRAEHIERGRLRGGVQRVLMLVWGSPTGRILTYPYCLWGHPLWLHWQHHAAATHISEGTTYKLHCFLVPPMASIGRSWGRWVSAKQRGTSNIQGC